MWCVSPSGRRRFPALCFRWGPAIFLSPARFIGVASPGRTLLLRPLRDDPDPAGAGGGLRHPRASMVVRAGWPRCFHAFGWRWEFSPYGLQGIPVAHVFFNMPMAARLLLQALGYSGEQRQIAAVSSACAAMPFSGWSNGRGCAGIPAVAALILCSALPALPPCCHWAAARRPRRLSWLSTEALNFDYDPARAAMLALIQMLCCLGLVLLSQRLGKTLAIGVQPCPRLAQTRRSAI